MSRKLTTAILTSLAVILMATPLLAAGESPSPSGPKAVVEEAVADLGTIPKGHPAIHDFTIRNAGDAPLEITKVVPGCGCTVATFDHTIAPGQTGKIHAEMDTSDFNGGVARGITVFTNDPDHPRLELTLKVVVKPQMVAFPGYARYIVVHGEDKEGVIPQYVWAEDGKDFHITKIDSPSPYLTTSFRRPSEEELRPEGKGKKQWLVTLDFDYNRAPVGALRGYVVVHTDHAGNDEVKIPLSGFVRPTVALNPPTVDLGTVADDKPVKTGIILQQFLADPMKLTDPETDIPGIEVQIKPIEAGRKFEVLFTAGPGVPKGVFQGKVRIHTDSPKKPIIEVPFHGKAI